MSNVPWQMGKWLQRTQDMYAEHLITETGSYFLVLPPLDIQLQAWEFIPGNVFQKVLTFWWLQGKEGYS